MSRTPKTAGTHDGVIIVSACLAGISCRWNGKDSLNDETRKLVAEGKAIPVCPEELGDLPTPRPPSEIIGANGQDVLDQRASVHNKFGVDVTKEFVKGAKRALRIAKKARAGKAILKIRSTSCGLGEIYDGTFSHKLKRGDGVTAAIFLRAGIEVIGQD